METGIVFDIKELTLFDGKGINITVFMKGCPLHCIWCHNPEGISNEIKMYGSKRVGLKLTSDDLAIRLNRYTKLQEAFGGFIIFSGGEPLQQTDFIIETIKKLYYKKIIIDTSGYTNKNDLIIISPYVEKYYYDLKIIDENLHRAFTGQSNQIIIDNLYFLDRLNKEIVIRVPLINGITDSSTNIQAIANVIKKCNNINRIEFLQENPYTYSKYKSLNIPFVKREKNSHQFMLDRKIFNGIPVEYFRV